MIITTAHVTNHLGDITEEQIGKCTKCFDENRHEWFYKVESEEVKFDQDGYKVEYTVRYSREHGYTCTCPSGQHGFATVRHASGVCKHVRWSVAASREERAALAEITHHEAEVEIEASTNIVGTIAGKRITKADIAALTNAKPHSSKAKPIERKGFSLFR